MTCRPYPLRFVAIDLETTGIDPDTCEIIEIGAVLFENDLPSTTFRCLVRPVGPVPPFVQTLTGLDPSDLAGHGLPIAEALTGLRDFVGDLPVAAHHAEFDLQFLEQAARSACLPPWEPLCFDTLLGSRMAFPEEPSHRLASLAASKGLIEDSEKSHRALDDATVAGRLLVASTHAFHAMPEPARAVLGWLLAHTRSPWRFVLPVELPAPPPRALPELPDEAPPRLGPARPWALDPDSLTSLLAPKGRLWQTRGDLEVRQAQCDMAVEVATALRDDLHLVVEAGTGTGKTLAYLLPAACWALGTRDRVVVATATRPLQDQILQREMPTLATALDGDLRAAVLKGRNNYLCVRRWTELVTHPERLAESEREAILPLVAWVFRTLTGDVEECHGFGRTRNASLWAKLQSDARAPLPPRSPLHRACFWQRARRRAESAHLLVVNHALLLTDLALDFGILPTYERLVIDEAHGFPETAQEHLGRTVSQRRLRQSVAILGDAADPRTGALGAVTTSTFLSPETRSAAESLREILPSLDRAFQKLLQRMVTCAQRQGKAQRLRYQGSLTASWGLDPSAVLALIADIAVRGQALADQLLNHEDALERGWPGEVRAGAETLDELRRDLSHLIEGAATDEVFWLEDFGNPMRLKLRCAPDDISGVLAQRLWPSMRTAVLTSATLQVRGDPGFFLGRCGLDHTPRPRLATSAHPSPFDLRRQARVLVARHLPRPTEEGFDEAAAALLVHAVVPVRVGTLVLFTSERALRATREALAVPCLAANRLLLAQGVDGDRGGLLELFRRTPGAILLGTDSFWEGVDLPGRELELVVVGRLPFPVPADPLIASRADRVRESGGNPFNSCFLPEAHIRLRQGVGRLLRRTDDRGAVLVLDSRVARERYGAGLAQAWGGGHLVIDTDERIRTELQTWFG